MNFGITIGKTARTDGAIIVSILDKLFYTNLLNKSIFLTVVRRYIEKEMNESMNRWLASYEARRTRGADMSSKGLLSSRFDLEGLTWDEIRDIPIEELGPGMTFGKGCEQLRKTWLHLKLNRAEGNYHNIDLELRINRLQHFLGFERTQFDDLDPSWVDQELLMEEEQSNEASDDLNGKELSKQLRREEFKDQLNAWGLDDDDEW